MLTFQQPYLPRKELTASEVAHSPLFPTPLDAACFNGLPDLFFGPFYGGECAAEAHGTEGGVSVQTSVEG
jgi:hypothetical protein